jgi:hypothetical protein
VTPSFLHVASTCCKHASFTSLLDLPLVSASTFLECVLVSPDSGQVGGSFGGHGALSSLQAPGPTPQRLDVRLRTCPGGLSFLDPCAPYATSSTTRLHSGHSRRDRFLDNPTTLDIGFYSPEA